MTTISGTTGIDRVQDGSIEQADLAPNVVGNGPVFRAYAASSVTALSGTDTKINFDSKDYDTAGAFDPALDRFQPSVAGYYQFNASMVVSLSNSLIILSFRKNGAVNSVGTAVVERRTSVSDVIYLNGTTDYVEVFGFSSTGQNTLTGKSGTYFSGFLARAA